MIELELAQYGSMEVDLTEDRARRLREGANGALAVAVLPQRGRWLLTAQESVGTLVVDDMRVLITPKIPPENLFLLLEVGLPPNSWRREAFDYATTADLLPSVVAFFSRTAETALARGLLRSYRADEGRLLTLRGRIDIAATFRQPGQVAPVPCKFDEFTEDIFENRYLRAAVQRCLRVPGVLAEDRRRLLRLSIELEGVSDVYLRPDDLDGLLVDRLNEHYLPALRLGRVLLENLTLIDQGGRTAASSFLVDMNKLFERFVTERLRKALRGRLELRAEPPVHLGVGRRVRMYPDLEFRRKGETVFVGDCKYKLTGDARARNADYYQLLAYTTALQVDEGVLVYCLRDDGVSDSTVTVRHAGKRLSTYAIRLGGGADEVRREIEVLADWIAERSLQRSTPLAASARG